MITVKNIQFTLLIPVDTRVREFNFRQRTPELYDGNTTDEQGERFYFRLIMERGQWIFANESLPAWLLKSEQRVRDAIIEREAAWSLRPVDFYTCWMRYVPQLYLRQHTGNRIYLRACYISFRENPANWTGLIL